MHTTEQPTSTARWSGLRASPAMYRAGACLAAALLVQLALSSGTGAQGAQPRPVAGAAQAAPPDSSSAQGVALAYLEASRKGDWTGATRLVHGDALSRFKGAFVLLAAGDTGKALVTEIFELPDIAALEKMSERDLFRRFMERVGSRAAPNSAVLAEARLEILGAVDEGASVRHVVHRLTMNLDGVPIASVDVLTVKRDGAGWKVQLTSEVDAMIAGIRRGMAR